MTEVLRQELMAIARQEIPSDDPSHDINHTLRVLANAERIASAEGADLDVVVPAALFHDVITYAKNDPRSAQAQAESADKAKSILVQLNDFPKDKIEAVAEAIRLCSFSKGLVPERLEAKVLQDADGLEVTGAISIMRTFSSGGQMGRSFYHTEDPFAEKRPADDKTYSLDLFYTRLLVVSERMHTHAARQIAEGRTRFLGEFLNQFKRELYGN